MRIAIAANPSERLRLRIVCLSFSYRNKNVEYMLKIRVDIFSILAFIVTIGLFLAWDIWHLKHFPFFLKNDLGKVFGETQAFLGTESVYIDVL